MPNMSHCRFRNTLAALRDANDHIPSTFNGWGNLEDEEREAAVKLIKLCHKIAGDCPLEDLE